MKKMELSPTGKKRAAAGVAICFIATLVLTGAYTWKNYQNKIAEEERLMEEQMAKADEEAQAAKEGKVIFRYNNFLGYGKEMGGGSKE